MARAWPSMAETLEITRSSHSGPPGPVWRRMARYGLSSGGLVACSSAPLTLRLSGSLVLCRSDLCRSDPSLFENGPKHVPECSADVPRMYLTKFGRFPRPMGMSQGAAPQHVAKRSQIVSCAKFLAGRRNLNLRTFDNYFLCLYLRRFSASFKSVYSAHFEFGAVLAFCCKVIRRPVWLPRDSSDLPLPPRLRATRPGHQGTRLTTMRT